MNTFRNAVALISKIGLTLTVQLCRVTCPTLPAFGDADPISPHFVGERLAALVADARVVESSEEASDHYLVQAIRRGASLDRPAPPRGVTPAGSRIPIVPTRPRLSNPCYW